MSLEAMKIISEAEETARHRKADAVQEAKRTVAQAQSLAAEAIEAAHKKAAEELGELSRNAAEKAKADVIELAGNTENRKAAMRAHAESKLDDAARLIVERIVNS